MRDLAEVEKYRDRDAEKRVHGVFGDNGNGCFKVFVNGRSFFVIASNGGGWDHVSVTTKSGKRCPTWDEMCAIKNMFFLPEECVLQYHPAEKDYVNIYPYCLHLWRPQNQKIPTPDNVFV